MIQNKFVRGVISWTSAIIMAAGVLFVGMVIMPKGHAYYQQIIEYLNPVLGEFVANNWRFDRVRGNWSAHVYGEKLADDNTCVFIKDQLVVALVKQPGELYPFEVAVNFLNDDTPGSNRPRGYNDFGRWEFKSKLRPIEKDASITVSVKHKCTNRTPPEVTTKVLPPFIVGVDGVPKSIQ